MNPSKLEPLRNVCPPCIIYDPKPDTTRTIERVPYSTKVVQYEDYQFQVDQPVHVKKVQYDEVIKTLPQDVKVTDYYVVQTTTSYQKVIVPQRRVQLVPVQRVYQRVKYKPVKRTISHKPNQVHQPVKSYQYTPQPKPPVVEDSTATSKQRQQGFRNLVGGQQKQITFTDFVNILSLYEGEKVDNQTALRLWSKSNLGYHGKIDKLVQGLVRLSEQGDEQAAKFVQKFL